MDPASSGWNLFTQAQEDRLGQEMSGYLEGVVPVLDSPDLDSALQEFLGQVSRGSGYDNSRLHLNAIAADDLHAIAVPGGHIYISTGLIEASQTGDRLAGIVTHMLAHSALRHSTQAISQSARFKIRAVLVAADSGRATMLEGLQASEIHVHPGAPLSHFSEDQEIQAVRLATQWLDSAGLDPVKADPEMAWLRNDHPADDLLLLAQHPALTTPVVQPGNEPKRNRTHDRRRESAYRAILAAISDRPPDDRRLALYLATSPPPKVAVASPRREMYITRDYQFSYPQSWIPGKPTRGVYFTVAPKGLSTGKGDARDIEVGVIANSITPAELKATPMQTLLAQLPEIRPNLAPSDHQDEIDFSDFALDNLLLERSSPDGTYQEWVWAVATHYQGRLVYFLMAAPEDLFDDYQTEFNAIQRSIQFEGPPQNGRAEASDEERRETDRSS